MPKYTIGKLYIDNQYVCDTLEDTDRGLEQKDSLELITKMKQTYPGKTAIPSGTYSIEYTYSNKFKRLLPLLIDVPGFEGIRIHPGNTSEDTLGCILPGKNTIKGKVTDSKECFNRVVTEIKWAIRANEGCTITIK